MSSKDAESKGLSATEKSESPDGGAATGTSDYGPGTVPRYPIGSVDKALRLLLLFREHETLRLAEASKQLGVVRSTAHRLFAMLQYHGFVRQDPITKAYHAGPGLWDLGLSVLRNVDIRASVRPFLEELVEALEETVQLVVLQGTEARFVDAVEGPKALRTASRVGVSYPAHSTSGGKVLLAELTTARLRELYPSSRLPTLTTSSIQTRAALESELEQIRAQGYAINRGESEPEIGAIAVVQSNALGSARAAIALSAPLARLEEIDLPATVAKLRDVAARAAHGII